MLSTTSPDSPSYRNISLDQPKDKQSKGERSVRQKINHLVTLSLLSSLAIVLFVLESSLPNPFPWLRFGLANIIIMIGLALFGFKDGLFISLIRTTVGSIIIGSFLGPAFWLSLAGGLASVLIMGLAYKLFSSLFSLIGISILGAYTHSLTQLALVFLFLIQRREIFALLPFLLFCSLLTGFINGLAALYLLEYLKKMTFF